MLVFQDDLVIIAKVPGERGEAERGEERVLDGPEVRARRLGERRKDQLHAHGAVLGVGELTLVHEKCRVTLICQVLCDVK